MRRACSLGLATMALALGGLAQTAPVIVPPMPVIAPPVTNTFGMVGLAAGQTARLSVLNSVRTAPALLIPQVPCRADLSFYDSEGKLLKERAIDNLGFGKAAFLDLRRLDIADSARIQISGAVRAGALGVAARSPVFLFCNIVATLEVFDDMTGRTSAALSGPAITPIVPRPLPLSEGQTAPLEEPEP